MEEISLQELFQIIRKRIWLIIGLMIVSMLISGVFSFFILKPEYKTFTTLMVGKPKDYQVEDKIEYNDLLLNQRLVHTYGSLVQSRDVADKVISNLNLDISFENFSNKVNVNLLKDTEIIKLEVTDEDPELVALIANETADVFMDSVKKFMNIENVQVIDKAQVPEHPVKPRPMLNIAISGILGLMIGIFVVFLMEFLDKTIKKPEDIEKILEIPVIGTIPLMSENDDKLISIHQPKSPISEAFRTMRTNIQFSQIDNNLKSIVVTSSMPSEGKSTIAANLAAILAQSGKDVLLIDCDMRKPRVNRLFKLDNRKGLTTVLLGRDKLEDAIHKNEEQEGLFILTSGPNPPNPAELIGSKKMSEFIKEMEDNFDVVIIDSPPVGMVTDAVVLSTVADGLILVTASGETDIELIKVGVGLIKNVESNLIGGVLNKIPIEKNAQYGYYSYYGEESIEG